MSKSYKMKKLNKSILLIVAILCLVVSAIGLICFGVAKRRNGALAEVTQSGKLYWNVYREVFSPYGETSRESEEDGFYHITFAVEGEQVEYLVEEAQLVEEIDKQDLMGLAIDKNGIIRDVLNVRDLRNEEIATNAFVVHVDDGRITTNSTPVMSGMTEEFEITENTLIYDVSSANSATGGKLNNLKVVDRIRAFKNEQGVVSEVFVVERADAYVTETEEGWCDHCDQIVEWQKWTQEEELPIWSGHFRLMNNVWLNEQAMVNKDQNVILDLNGMTVTGHINKRVYALFNEGAKLAVLDQSEVGTGKLVAHGATDQGGIVWVRYGSFELYSGTLDASGNVALMNGPAVCVEGGKSFHMYGGTIIGGTAKANLSTNLTTIRGGLGGAVFIGDKGAEFCMYGGTIRDGRAEAYVQKDGTLANGAGGNLYVADGGHVTLDGGEILNGYADVRAGNIILGGEMTMKSGLISGGNLTNADGNGGNLYVATTGIFHLEGGTIKDGTVFNCGANVALMGKMYISGGTITNGKQLEGKTAASAKEIVSDDSNIWCLNGTLHMTGGYVKGHVEVANYGEDKDGNPKKSTLILSDKAKISGGTKNLYLSGGALMDLDKLKNGAEIWVENGGYVSTETHESNKYYIHTKYKETEVLHYAERILIGKVHCICGNSEHFGECDGTMLAWQPWESNQLVPNKDGNWYLTEDINTTAQRVIEKDAVVRLNLNGKHIYGATDERVYQLREKGVQLLITDCSKEQNGSIVARGENVDQGGCLWLRGNSGTKVSLYAGILDASNAIGRKGGVAVCVDNDCDFNMYGGTIKGGTTKHTDKGIGTSGGSVYVIGKFSMWNGVIRDGKAEWCGGNVGVSEEGKFNLYGGVIQNGSAKGGGNLFAYGQVDVTGGKIDGGSATAYGGNLYLPVEGKLCMTGGLICGGTATEEVRAGNARVVGTFEMIAGCVDGQLEWRGAKEFLLSKSATITSDNPAGLGLYIPEGKQVTLGTLNEDAVIHINGVGQVTTATAKNDYANQQVQLDHAARATSSSYYLGDVKDGVGVVYEAGALYVGKCSCVCGYTLHIDEDKSEGLGICKADESNEIASHETHVWIPWRNDKTLPGSDTGYYYLTRDVQSSGQKAITNKKVHIDLNGKTVSNKEGVRLFTTHTSDKSGSILRITDLSANRAGRMVLTGQGDSGLGFWVTNNCIVEMYAGTLDTSQGHTKNADDSFVHITNEGIFRMFGGKITTENPVSGADVKEHRNIGVASGCAFEMSQAAVVENGSSVKGGANVYVYAGGYVHVDGGTIQNGRATWDGGNVYTAGTFIMNNAKILNGEAAYGGNVLVSRNGILKMSGTESRITGGTANNGGNVRIMHETCSLEVTGGEISGGKSKAGNTGEAYNVLVSNGGAIIKNCTIEGIRFDNLTSSIQIDANTKLIAPENKAGLYIKKVAEGVAWLNLNESYSADSNGKIEIKMEESNLGQTVMNKGISLGDRTRFAITQGGDIGQLVFVKDQVLVKSAALHIHCPCGGSDTRENAACDHWEVEYTTFANWGRNIGDTSANYYLSDNVTLTSVQNLVGNKNGDATDTKLNICLNGKTMTGKTGERLLQLYGDLNLVLCGECEADADKNNDGCLKAVKTTGDSQAGGVLVCRKYSDGTKYTGVARLYNVYLDASAYITNAFPVFHDVEGVGEGKIYVYNSSYSNGRNSSGTVLTNAVNTTTVFDNTASNILSGETYAGLTMKND